MDDNIENHANNLKKFIDLVTNWDSFIADDGKVKLSDTRIIDFISCVNDNSSFYKNFKMQLKVEFGNPTNIKDFEIELKSRFISMIEHYCNWYSLRRSKKLEFAQSIFYHNTMYESCVNTEKEIYKYYPKVKSIDTQSMTKENHTNIFKDNGFVLFDYLYNNKKTKSVITDIGFYYRSMENDFLKVGEAEFRRWIKNEYNIKMSKIKKDESEMDTSYNVRQSNYKEGLEWFQSNYNYGNKIGTKTE